MLTFKIVTEKEECYKLWEKFSPKKILWDLWDFRYCFHTDNFEFNFLLGIKNNAQIGLIPLVYDKKESYYTYFGGDFPEKNKFYIEDKSLLPKFLEQYPNGTEIYYIDASESRYYNLKKGEKRYFLILDKFGNNFDNYISSFTKKHRKNLRYDLKQLQKTGYSVKYNQFKDFTRFIDLNKERFGQESSFNDENFVRGINNLIKTAEKMRLIDTTSIEIDNKVEAVGLGVYYNKCYYVLGISRNAAIKNLGKLLIAEQIKNAIRLNCSEIDFLSTESNWKDLWNLESEQMYEFQK